MKKSIICLLLGVAFTFLSCNETNQYLDKKEEARKEKEKTVQMVENHDKLPDSKKSKIIDYHNGVYYFDSIRDEFAESLSKLIGEKPEWRLVMIVNDGTGGYGMDSGYFVIFEKKESKTQ